MPRLLYLISVIIFLILPLAAPCETVVPSPVPTDQASWRFVTGKWVPMEGAIEQTETSRGSAAILKDPAFSDFVLTTDFYIRPIGKGVRAAALIFRATGTLTYYWLHLDSKNSQAILVRSTPTNSWIEITRRGGLPLASGLWHTARVECKGTRISVAVDGKDVLSAEDAALTAGRIGLGTSQGAVFYRNLKIEGEIAKMSEPLKEEAPPYKVISRGEAAGPYQAFPDACRLKNGDILVVFYAGYGHVSLPNAEWPRGGRVCMVRSSDQGRTWSQPAILYDDENDNRDPHIAQMSDGTLICSFFSLRAKGGAYEGLGSQIVCSHDGGKSWEQKAETVARDWYCSAPVREMPDGAYLLGVYCEHGATAWGGVIRSTDRGATWSAPVDIGKEAGLHLDAETDVVLLKDGSLYAALRSSEIHMHYATSKDLGLTWTPVKDIGFRGHAPHFTRLSGGEILLTHRIPETALHVSRDEGRTWQGPYVLDTVGGAYPSTVELKDNTVLAIYYEEGEGSAIRALRFRLKPDGIEPLGWE